MKLEELIYQWFIKDKELAGRLAAFSGEPAVFYQAAPADNQEGWKGGQYPRIVYAVDMQANQGRRSAGEMSVIILCDEAGRSHQKRVEQPPALSGWRYVLMFSNTHLRKGRILTQWQH